MAVVIFFSFALQFYVPMEFITRLLKRRQSNTYENVIQITIRTVLVSTVGEFHVSFINTHVESKMTQLLVEYGADTIVHLSP